MTKDQPLERLKAYALNPDVEAGHSDVDRALIEYIDDPKVEEVYDAAIKQFR